MQLLNTQADIDWLNETCCKHSPVPDAKSALVVGNEDAPIRVVFYASVNPEVTERPMRQFVINPDTGLLVEDKPH